MKSMAVQIKVSGIRFFIQLFYFSINRYKQYLPLVEQITQAVSD